MKLREVIDTGNAVNMRHRKRTEYKHKLVAVGDSLAQGFKNGGVYRTDLSFPALIARAMGPNVRFDTPSFSAQAGIPLNVEVLVRGLADEFGDTLKVNNLIPAGRHLYTTLRRIKSYWEDESNHLHRKREIPYHNQGVWGFAANDAWLMSERKCRQYLRENKPRYSIFSILPDHAMYITGRIVLNPGFTRKFARYSQLDNLSYLHRHGGVENLILCTGHNNIAGALSELRIIYSGKDFSTRHHHERDFTVYRPEHFEMEMQELFERVAAIGVPNVFVPTIPYMTIPPVTRGVNSDRSECHEGYFDYYTRFWIWDEDFDPEKHPHMLREDAIELDLLIDRYNAIIRQLCNRYGFHPVPVGKHVSAVARRRLGVNAIRPYPQSFIDSLKSNPNTAHLVQNDGKVMLSTDFLQLDEKSGKLARGGIFSLDGLHPSTIGYGLIANIYKMTMEKAGVHFENELDWDFIIKNETLVSDPPYLLTDLRLFMRFLSLGSQERITRAGQNIFQHLLEIFSRRKSQVDEADEAESTGQDFRPEQED